MTQVPVDTHLFTWPSASPHLLGSRCRRCAAECFPVQSGCPRCGREDLEIVELPAGGRLWTWTSQDFLPKAPPYGGPETSETFQRWFVGYVELAGGLHVEARLVGLDGRNPRIGEDVELVIVPFGVDEDGREIMIHAFAPASASLEVDDV